MSRSRTQTTRDSGNYYLRDNGNLILHNTGTLVSNDVCVDELGRGVDHPLSIEKWSNRTTPLNGTMANGFTTLSAEFDNYLEEYHGTFGSHDVTLDVLDLTTAATRAIARSNPSRPDLSPLELAQDLYDLPRQLRDIGRLLATKDKKRLLTAKEAANQNLAIQFGWLPFISDVKSLFSFHSSVNRRAGELHRLYGRGGLRRRIFLHSRTSYHEGTSPRYSIGPEVVSSYWITKSQVDQWGVVRWLPTSLPYWSETEEGLNRQARKLVSGLTYEGFRKGTWAIIPWSWLVGWFTNLNDYVVANSYSVPASVSQCNIMTHWTTETLLQRNDNTTAVSGGSGFVKLETKSRSQGSLGLAASWPLFSANQLSILGSLNVQRLKTHWSF